MGQCRKNSTYVRTHQNRLFLKLIFFLIQPPNRIPCSSRSEKSNPSIYRNLRRVIGRIRRSEGFCGRFFLDRSLNRAILR